MMLSGVSMYGRGGPLGRGEALFNAAADLLAHIPDGIQRIQLPLGLPAPEQVRLKQPVLKISKVEQGTLLRLMERLGVSPNAAFHSETIIRYCSLYLIGGRAENTMGTYEKMNHYEGNFTDELR